MMCLPVRGVSVLGGSLSGEALLQWWGLGGLCLGVGVSVQGGGGSLFRGVSAWGSVQGWGISIWGRGLCPGVLCPRRSLSRGSLSRGSLSKEVSVQGVSIQSGLCLVGVGGLCPRVGVSVQGGLSPGTPRTVKSGRYASYWNAFLFSIKSDVLFIQQHMK